MPSFAEMRSLLVKTYNEWSEDQAPRLGAALAYYTILSLAPLLILLLALSGLIFGDEAARGQLYTQIRDLVGAEGAQTIQSIVENASKPTSGIIASLIGFATLIFGASSVATELKYDLNTIWDQPPADESIGETIKHRSYALAIVLGCGFLLVVSLAVSSVVSAAGSFLMSMMPMSEVLLQILNMLVSVVVITGVFAVLFKYLPDVTIEWRDVLLGAAFTSVLFSIGKFLIGLYLGKASFGSTYGAAGSLVILLVWVYYSSQIFFFGAEFTQVYAAEHGSNPRRRRGWRRRPDQVGSSSATAPLPDSAGQAAAGVAQDGKRPIGVFGTLVGSALAFKKAVRGIKH